MREFAGMNFAGAVCDPVAEIRREHFTVESALVELKKAEKDERSARVRKGEIFANARETLPLAQYERLVKESGYAPSTVRMYMLAYQNPGYEEHQQERAKKQLNGIAVYRKLHAILADKGPKALAEHVQEFARDNL